MDATGFRPKGSFGIPDSVRKQIEDSAKPRTNPQQEQVQASQAQDSPKETETVAPSVAPDKNSTESEDQGRKDILNLKKMWEERLGITITEKDVREYIFRGRLIKEGLDVIPGYMKATFQTHNPHELAAVDQAMASFRESTKFTPEGLANENALQVLSYGWLKAAEIDGDTTKPYKLLGENPEQRRKTIQMMSSLVVQEVADSWDGFNILLKIALREKRLLKK